MVLDGRSDRFQTKDSGQKSRGRLISTSSTRLGTRRFVPPDRLSRKKRSTMSSPSRTTVVLHSRKTQATKRMTTTSRFFPRRRNVTRRRSVIQTDRLEVKSQRMSCDGSSWSASTCDPFREGTRKNRLVASCCSRGARGPCVDSNGLRGLCR
jgi:hypothetical protein